MQVIEVSMCHQHRINRGQVHDTQAGVAQALQDEKPSRKVRIDNDVLATDLYEEAGMANEGDPELSMTGKHGFASQPRSGGYDRVPNQFPELFCLTTYGYVEHYARNSLDAFP